MPTTVMKPGNANLPIGGLQFAIQENGVPGKISNGHVAAPRLIALPAGHRVLDASQAIVHVRYLPVEMIQPVQDNLI